MNITKLKEESKQQECRLCSLARIKPNSFVAQFLFSRGNTLASSIPAQKVLDKQASNSRAITIVTRGKSSCTSFAERIATAVID